MSAGADREFLHDLFAEFGPVSPRRMFGGLGIFRDGVMFALVADGVLYLKADEGSSADFAAEGCEPFTYVRGGRTVALSYRRVPARLLDAPEELAVWAARAWQVACRSRAAEPAAPRNAPERRRP